MRITIFVIIAVLNIPLYASEKIEKLTLEKAIIFSLKNSKTIASLKGKQDVSKRLVGETWRGFLPDIGIRYQKDDTVSYREDDYRSHSVMIDISYEINTGGKTAIEYKLAKIEAHLALAEYKIEKNNIILQVKQKYYEVIKAKNEIEVNKKLLASLLLEKKIINEEYKLGMATGLQRIQVEARISEAEYRIKKSENDYKNKMKDLKAYVGIPFNSKVSLDTIYENFQIIKIPGLSKEELASISLKNRHELKKGRFSLLKARYEMELARYYYLPAVRLQGSYGYSGDRYPPNNKTWSFGVTVSTSIFGSSLSGNQTFGESDNGNSRSIKNDTSIGLYDNPSYASKMINAESAYRETTLSYKMLQNSITMEVIRAYDSYSEAIDMLEIAEKNVMLMEKQVEIEREKARLGEVTRRNVLDTYIELTKSRIRLLTAKTDYFMAIAVLENALGYSIGKLSGEKR